MIIVGHRGAPLEAKENTIQSFLIAKNLGVDAVELDVHLSSDKKLIVFHDDAVLINGQNTVQISDLTLEELRKVTGIQVPTLEEVFETVGDFNYVVEIKKSSAFYPSIEQRVVDAIRERGLVDNVNIISFDFDAVKRVKEIDEKISTGIIFVGRLNWFLEIAKKAKANWLGIYYQLVTEEEVKNAHQSGLKLNAWTVNDLASAEKLERIGIDALTTDNPRKMIEILKSRKKNT
ncbi:MAG: glycerophosphoryl diester phosphodiesterase [Candidatus Aramenus sulfurataquae]|jgi:glycerophosphoryl diester phosphodiesterase|uniref:Glycerophosphodiester phosphodiesterase n=2 Tax=Candidatus Aramenus sulfurataquae TaxID=1326980 RepID=W7KHC2_9CREN|nr:MAG: glycerophosphoryl diester phosphodiesterase [Candidatus Aramenus sulfurataquae]MCL7343909.1 glycerophosphodiester phosphodiesterase [Candidatus Aramenus sulfurataquae]